MFYQNIQTECSVTESWLYGNLCRDQVTFCIVAISCTGTILYCTSAGQHGYGHGLVGTSPHRHVTPTETIPKPDTFRYKNYQAEGYVMKISLFFCDGKYFIW